MHLDSTFTSINFHYYSFARSCGHLWNCNTLLYPQESKIWGEKRQLFKHHQEAYVSSKPEVKQLTEQGAFILEMYLDVSWICSLVVLC